MILIDPSAGTHVIGSRLGRLITTYRAREGDDYPHSVVGKLHFADDWLLVNLKGDVQDYYAWYVKKLFGIKLHVRSLWGAHVSVIRGETITKNKHMWGKMEGMPITINYTHNIYTNGEHWWLNVESEELANLRDGFGMAKTNKKWFHLTIGRL